MWWRRLRYVLLLIALCSIATCPAARRACTAKVRAREADDLLRYLADQIAATVKATGKVPPLAAGPTPSPSCCEQGGTCAPEPSHWATPGWQALHFTIDGDHRYSYQYTPAADGLSATLTATGNLDCISQPRAVQLDLKVLPGPIVTRTWTKAVPVAP